MMSSLGFYVCQEHNEMYSSLYQLALH